MGFVLKLCFAVVMLVVLQEATSLKCYQCTSTRHGNCDDPLNLTKVTIQTCSSPHNSCLLLNVTENGATNIRRECAESEYCNKNSSARNRRQVTTYARACRTCSWGLCNSAHSLVPSFGIGIAGLILIKYYL